MKQETQSNSQERDSEWSRVCARAMARRLIASGLASLADDERRSVLLDTLLEFAPDVFHALETSVNSRQERERALCTEERLRTERDALYTEVLRLDGDPAAILRGLATEPETSKEP
jgi:hypothetical protein